MLLLYWSVCCYYKIFLSIFEKEKNITDKVKKKWDLGSFCRNNEVGKASHASRPRPGGWGGQSAAPFIYRCDTVLSYHRDFCLFVFALKEGDAQSVTSRRNLLTDLQTSLLKKREDGEGGTCSVLCCRCNGKQELRHMLPPTERQGSCSYKLKPNEEYVFKERNCVWVTIPFRFYWYCYV